MDYGDRSWWLDACGVVMSCVERGAQSCWRACGCAPVRMRVELEVLRKRRVFEVLQNSSENKLLHTCSLCLDGNALHSARHFSKRQNSESLKQRKLSQKKRPQWLNILSGDCKLAGCTRGGGGQWVSMAGAAGTSIAGMERVSRRSSLMSMLSNTLSLEGTRQPNAVRRTSLLETGGGAAFWCPPSSPC